jgi:hypothetical protein
MIGRVKASRTAGEAARRAVAAAMRNLDLRICRSLDFVANFFTKAGHESPTFCSFAAGSREKKARIVGVRSGLNVEPRIGGDAALEVQWTLESLIKR